MQEIRQRSDVRSRREKKKFVSKSSCKRERWAERRERARRRENESGERDKKKKERKKKGQWRAG